MYKIRSRTPILVADVIIKHSIFLQNIIQKHHQTNNYVTYFKSVVLYLLFELNILDIYHETNHSIRFAL